MIVDGTLAGTGKLAGVIGAGNGYRTSGGEKTPTTDGETRRLGLPKEQSTSTIRGRGASKNNRRTERTDTPLFRVVTRTASETSKRNAPTSKRDRQLTDDE